MKTKIRSLIIICTLGLIGLNTNAATNKTTASAGTAGQFILNMDTDASIDFQKEAQLVTKWIADNEEAKTIQKVMDRKAGLCGELTDSFQYEVVPVNNDEITDFRSEAQLMTKLIADNAEAMAVQKLVAEGKISENR